VLKQAEADKHIEALADVVEAIVLSSTNGGYQRADEDRGAEAGGVRQQSATGYEGMYWCNYWVSSRRSCAID
jgi:hypothetical protein